MHGIRSSITWTPPALAMPSEHELSESLPESWRPHVGVMKDAAKAFDASDHATAAKGVAKTAAACGDCHAALGGPTLELSDPPAEASGAAEHMRRHQWAANTMWDALTTSNEAWRRAIEAMADAPLAPEAMSGPQSALADDASGS